MFNYIRGLPDFSMFFVMCLLGIAIWCVWLFVRFGIPYLWRRFKRSTAHKFIQLQRENVRLRKYISELRRENIRDNIR